MKHHIIIACAFLAGMLLFTSTSLLAQPAGAGLTDEQMRTRITEIQSFMNEGESGATTWWWSWLGIYSAFTAGSFTIAALSDVETERITYTVSGVQSALGVVGMLISPFAARYGPAEIRSLPTGNTGELRTSLAESERLMDAAADDAIMGRSWITHALALVVNGGGAMVIWKGYGDRIEDDGENPRKEAILNFVIGTIISEIQIFTQPTRAIRARDEYRRRHGLPAASDASSDVRFFAMPSGRGMMMGASLMF